MVKLEYVVAGELFPTYAEAVRRAQITKSKIVKRYRPFELSPIESKRRFPWKNGKRVPFAN